MGFHDLKLFNQALLARQAWRLVNDPSSLCARVLKAKYNPNGNLPDTAFPMVVSRTWRDIMYGLELLKKGLIWCVGDGRRINIWRSNWINRNYGLKIKGKRRLCRL